MNDNSIYLDKKNNNNACSKNHYRIIIFYINNKLIWFHTSFEPHGLFYKAQNKTFLHFKADG